MSKYSLKQNQRDAVDFFRKSSLPGSFFWHGMGLGKSLSSLHIAKAIRQIHLKHGDQTKTLILCSKSIQVSWETEIRKFCPEERPNIVLLPYSQMHNFVFQAKFTDIRLLIIDEYHYLRNAGTKRLENFTKLLIALTYGPKKFENGRIIGLSGTIIHNSALDLYNIFALFSSKTIKEAVKKFIDNQGRKRWASMFSNTAKGYSGRVKFTGLRNLSILQDIFTPILHKRDIDDCEDMPEKSQYLVDLGIDDDRLLRYVDVNAPGHFMSELEALSRAKTPHLITWIENFLEENEDEEQLVVFSMYKAPLKAIQEHFTDGMVELITGDQKLEDREDVVKRFQEKKVKIIGMTYACGAEGLNLQGARFGLYHSYPWTAALFQQAQARIHRSGQKRKTLHYVLTSGKYDKHIFNTVMRKSKTAEKFDGAIKK